MAQAAMSIVQGLVVVLLAATPHAFRVSLQRRARWASAHSGEVLKVKLKELIPTQGCVGFGQIHYHLARKQPDLARFPAGSAQWSDYVGRTAGKRGDGYCEANGMEGLNEKTWDPALLNVSASSTFECTSPEPSTGSRLAAQLRTVVVGPGGGLYLTDGHHTMNTLMTLADGGPELSVFVRVADNWKDASKEEFWQLMQDNLYLWLRDADDQPISTEALPKRLGMGNFQDDPYRTLVRLTKGMAYGGDGLPPFVEFKWGSWLRKKGLSLQRYDLTDLTKARVTVQDGKAVPRSGDSTTSYVALVRDAAILIAGAAEGEIIEDGQTARELGQLPWPSKEDDWNKALEKNVWRTDVKSSGSPRTGGRAWYALNYERCGGAPSTEPDCWYGSGSIAWN